MKPPTQLCIIDRDPLQIGSKDSSICAFDGENIVKPIWTWAWDVNPQWFHLTCKAKSAGLRQKPSQTPANCHIWSCRVGAAPLRKKHVTFRVTLNTTRSESELTTTRLSSDFDNTLTRYCEVWSHLNQAKCRMLSVSSPFVLFFWHINNEVIGVLGAFSHLQRERRKHDIHIATLRAQSEFSD